MQVSGRDTKEVPDSAPTLLFALCMFHTKCGSSLYLSFAGPSQAEQDRNDTELDIHKQLLIRDALVKELKVIINETNDKVHIK